MPDKPKPKQLLIVPPADSGAIMSIFARIILAAAGVIALASVFSGAARAASDEEIEQKLAPFINCINQSDFTLQRTFGNYRRIIDDIKKDKNTSNIHFSSGFEDGDARLENSLKCAEGLDKAVRASPKIEDLDRFAAQYTPAIRAFAPLAVEADRYYGQQDYKDDNWAKGQQLDEKLEPLIAKLGEASQGFHVGVKRELTGIRERELAAIEAKEGKNFRWQAANFMLAARGLLDGIDENPTAPGIAPAIERVQKAYDEAEAYSAAHPPAPGALPPAWKSMMSVDAGFLLRDAKELRRALESGKAKAPELENKYQSVVRNFNNLVNDYNNSPH